MSNLSASTLQWVYDYPGGARLSERFKSAFRVALAMVITYGISMAMDWDKAFWAALSVIFCSLTTTGESIDASIDRILGTAVAALVALVIVALFPQDRWLFLLSLSAFIAVCSYRMTGGTLRNAVWFNAGFNLPIIAILGESGGSIAPATFDMAVLRVQQTALGAIVYSLVAVLVWPRRGDADFVASMRNIGLAQHKLFTGYIARLVGAPRDEALERSLAEVAAQMPTLAAKLEAAAYDSPELRLVAPAWRRHIGNVQALHGAFERWRFGIEDLEGLELRRFIPEWDDFIDEVEARFQGVDLLLSGAAAPRQPQPLDLSLDEQALLELPHFQRAAVVSCRDRAVTIAGLAGSLFDSASRVRSGDTAAEHDARPVTRAKPWTIDLDRLSTTVRQTSALWMVFLLIIYVEAVPIAVAFIALTNAFSMAFGKVPHVPATVLFKPVIMGGLAAGIFYMLVMPHLSGFREFGLLFFAVIFAIAYYFHDPRVALVRGMWMTMLVLIMGADNQQSYSFLIFANWFLVGILFVSVMVVAWRFPISFKPEDRFRAQLRRFLRSAGFLLDDLAGERERGRLYQWQRAFHEHELTVLPVRLRVWSSMLPPAALGDTDPRQLDGLLNTLELLGYRVQDLREAHGEAGALARVVRRHIGEDELPSSLANMMQHLAQDPAALDEKTTRERLEKAETSVEQALEAALDDIQVTQGASQRVYRLLGSYRGMLQTFGDLVGGLARIDWPRLSEARF